MEIIKTKVFNTISQRILYGLNFMYSAYAPVESEKTDVQSQKKLQKLLAAGKGKHYYAETEGAIRYVVADNGEKGLTFAVEPIKLALSESLEGLNK